MSKLIAVLLASFVAAACSIVRSDVTVSHMLPAASGKTVAIMPYAPRLASAPDYQSYSSKLAAHLAARGYTVVAAQGQADYIAYFHYGVDGSTPVNLLVSSPAPNTGSIITYGIRSPYNQATRRVYSRTVIVEILDRARFQPNNPQSYVGARVYSGWVKSDGVCSSMAPLIDPMLTALFAEFPGPSGVRTIDLPTGDACGPHRFG